jgi:hypothetical protein
MRRALLVGHNKERAARPLNFTDMDHLPAHLSANLTAGCRRYLLNQGQMVFANRALTLPTVIHIIISPMKLATSCAAKPVDNRQIRQIPDCRGCKQIKADGERCFHIYFPRWSEIAIIRFRLLADVALIIHESKINTDFFFSSRQPANSMIFYVGP